MSSRVASGASSLLRRAAKRQILRHQSADLFRQSSLTHRLQLRQLSALPSSELASSNVPAKLIDFASSSKIEGQESQVAHVKLLPGERLRAESGAMLYMTDGVEMDTSLQGAGAAFSRLMTGQNVFLTDFTYTGSSEGTVGLGTDFPSKILRLSLEDYENSALICQRGAYMASNPSVDIQMEYTKSLTAGFFGGQGFILQRLVGQGDVLIKAGGTLVVKDLAEGEKLRVTSGSIVAFTTTIDYDVQMMPGIKNAMFGGEGLFVTTLTGPGQVWLQGMPADRMISEIARRVPSGGGFGLGIPIGVGGGGSEDAGTTDGVAEDVGEGTSGEEMVAATDAAVDADRQATVASSSMMSDDGSAIDSESPSALFGDAAPENVAATSTTSSSPFEDSMGDETTTFSNDPTTFSDETSFSNDSISDNEFEEFQEQNQDAFEDSTTTDFFESGSSEEATESGGGLLGTLWDIITGGGE